MSTKGRIMKDMAWSQYSSWTASIMSSVVKDALVARTNNAVDGSSGGSFHSLARSIMFARQSWGVMCLWYKKMF